MTKEQALALLNAITQEGPARDKFLQNLENDNDLSLFVRHSAGLDADLVFHADQAQPEDVRGEDEDENADNGSVASKPLTQEDEAEGEPALEEGEQDEDVLNQDAPPVNEEDQKKEDEAELGQGEQPNVDEQHEEVPPSVPPMMQQDDAPTEPEDVTSQQHSEVSRFIAALHALNSDDEYEDEEEEVDDNRSDDVVPMHEVPNNMTGSMFLSGAGNAAATGAGQLSDVVEEEPEQAADETVEETSEAEVAAGTGSRHKRKGSVPSLDFA